MRTKLGAHLRNNLIAYVALFIALTSGAYAAGLGKDSVGAKQIKSGAVRNADIADNAVTSAKVADGSLTPADIAGGQTSSGRSWTPPGTW